MNIQKIWPRITDHEGETFTTKTGLEFSYHLEGNNVVPDRTEYFLSKSEFEKALSFLPMQGPGEISNEVRGSSYIWAILHDSRIRMDDW